ncbi:Uncharacterised protein [Vibrio cholerae]|nr:Uncharacterised protein [Vibrio cholerae]CSC49448.1 Uncharacterised protein [Vibrio cholerae]
MATDTRLGRASISLTSCSSSSAQSCGKRLIATTAGTPYWLTLSICHFKFAKPACKAALSGANRASGTAWPGRKSYRPELAFKPRKVATITAQSGVLPDALALMLHAFSNPISEPKPPSVTV